MRLIVVRELPSQFIQLVEYSQKEKLSYLSNALENWIQKKNCFDKAGELFVCAFDDQEQIVGCCGLNQDPYINDHKIGRLRHLYVAPERRNKGLGKLLVRSCLKNAHHNFEVVRLKINSHFPQSSEFYLKLGFEKSNISETETHRMHLRQ